MYIAEDWVNKLKDELKENSQMELESKRKFKGPNRKKRVRGDIVNVLMYV